MESLLQDIPGVVVYLSDVLNTASDEDLRMTVLERSIAQDGTGRSLPESKQVPVYGILWSNLGYKIDAESLHPLLRKVQAIKEAPRPYR